MARWQEPFALLQTVEVLVHEKDGSSWRRGVITHRTPGGRIYVDVPGFYVRRRVWKGQIRAIAERDDVQPAAVTVGRSEFEKRLQAHCTHIVIEPEHDGFAVSLVRKDGAPSSKVRAPRLALAIWNAAHVDGITHGLTAPIGAIIPNAALTEDAAKTRRDALTEAAEIAALTSRTLERVGERAAYGAAFVATEILTKRGSER